MDTNLDHLFWLLIADSEHLLFCVYIVSRITVVISVSTFILIPGWKTNFRRLGMLSLVFIFNYSSVIGLSMTNLYFELTVIS